MNREEMIKLATKKISDTIRNNTELFMAQAIIMNPEINTLEYSWCSQMCFDEDGKCYHKHWLEKLT